MNLLMGDAIFDRRKPQRRLPADPLEIVIVTRFNLYLPPHKADLSETERAAWSAHRLELFQRYCLRSVRWQSAGGFSWLLLCDAAQEAVAEQLEARLQGMPGAHVIRCPRHEEPGVVIREAVQRFVAQMPESDRTLICTVRLDADDALNRHHLANLQLYARWFFGRRPDRAPVFLSFPFGAQMEGERFHGFSYPHNPFVALVERRGSELLTAYCCNHSHISDKAPVQFLQTRQPMWLQVVHGQNVSNQMLEGTVPLSLDVLTQKKMFGLMPSPARPVAPATPR